MSYRSTRALVEDLVANQRCIIVDEPVSPNLEMAEIQRRVYARGGPAIWFTAPVGSSFSMASNLFSSLEQARFIFRDTIESVRRAIELKIDPNELFKRPLRYLSAPRVGLSMRPKTVRRGPILDSQTTISKLPQLICWPDDGGAFITLPQVLSQAVDATRLADINLGMYRIQLSGNVYQVDRQIGLHYQLHRGIGVHHQTAGAADVDLPVTITVGGSPAMSVAAVMPLPEGMSELTFAGALAGHRIGMIVTPGQAPLYADADFAILGKINPSTTLPEGPFGDHLGYYAKTHDFPVLTVDKVYYRRDAVWPFTVVGRPPQEDTTFGELIHELTGPILPTVIPGVKAVNAVDAAGVHPLLLAIGSERYMPYRKPDRPAELLTQACAILGQGQLSLAKYLWIMDGNSSDAKLDINDTQGFFQHMLCRVDWTCDLHFITRTTIDTLDYSGEGFNQGSKVIIAAGGQSRRTLKAELPPNFPTDSIADLQWCDRGIVALQMVDRTAHEAKRILIEQLAHAYQNQNIEQQSEWQSLSLIVLVDDAKFTAKSWSNFLWTTFTRSNPAVDIEGVDAFIQDKHWGCRGPLIIDATIKPHHAAPLIEDAKVSAKIDAMASRGGPLARYL